MVVLISAYWIMITLMLLVSMVFIHGFIGGFIHHLLNKNAIKKRRKGQTIKESLTFSRFKDVLPKSCFIFYYFIIVLHFVFLLVISIFIMIDCSADSIRKVFGFLFCFDCVWISVVWLLFCSPNSKSYAYDRWFEKETKKNKKQKKKARQGTAKQSGDGSVSRP